MAEKKPEKKEEAPAEDDGLSSKFVGKNITVNICYEKKYSNLSKSDPT